MTLISLLFSLVFVVLTIPVLMFVIEVLGSLLPTKQAVNLSDETAPGPVAIIVPAHNEGENIRPTLNDIREQLRPIDRLVVIADNCDDNTAMIAREEGALCYERNDLVKRGKGYAIEFALQQLGENPPEIVMFFDADTRLEKNTCAHLAANAHKTNRPVQSLNIMHAGKEASPRLQVAAFAWLVMNRARMSGLFKLFNTTRMTGTGMAYPWSLIHDSFKGSGNIVEDLAFTLGLVRDGYAPILVHETCVHGEFPNSEEAAVTQRARWEHGTLNVAKTSILPMLGQAITKVDPKMLAMALDLAIPPLTMQIALSLGLSMLGIFLALVFSITLPLIIALTGLALLFGAIIMCWAVYGRKTLPPQAMVGIIGFILDKFRIYGKSGRQSSASWTRTERD